MQAKDKAFFAEAKQLADVIAAGKPASTTVSSQLQIKFQIALICIQDYDWRKMQRQHQKNQARIRAMGSMRRRCVFAHFCNHLKLTRTNTACPMLKCTESCAWAP